MKFLDFKGLTEPIFPNILKLLAANANIALALMWEISVLTDI